MRNVFIWTGNLAGYRAPGIAGSPGTRVAIRTRRGAEEGTKICDFPRSNKAGFSRKNTISTYREHYCFCLRSANRSVSNRQINLQTAFCTGKFGVRRSARRTHVFDATDRVAFGLFEKFCALMFLIFHRKYEQVHSKLPEFFLFQFENCAKKKIKKRLNVCGLHFILRVIFFFFISKNNVAKNAVIRDKIWCLRV